MKNECKRCGKKTYDVFDTKEKFRFCHIVNEWICFDCKEFVNEEFYFFKQKMLKNHEQVC